MHVAANMLFRGTLRTGSSMNCQRYARTRWPDMVKQAPSRTYQMLVRAKTSPKARQSIPRSAKKRNTALTMDPMMS